MFLFSRHKSIFFIIKGTHGSRYTVYVITLQRQNTRQNCEHFLLGHRIGQRHLELFFFIFLLIFFVAFFRHIDRYKDKAVDELDRPPITEMPLAPRWKKRRGGQTRTIIQKRKAFEERTSITYWEEQYNGVVIGGKRVEPRHQRETRFMCMQ